MTARVLVPGAAGFTGSHCARTRLGPARPGDVTAGELLAGHDRIAHFAAGCHADRSIRGAGDFVRTDVPGTQTLRHDPRRAGPRAPYGLRRQSPRHAEKKGSTR
ncbi:hypothetical protein ABZ646_21100 [Streptomyces sp. NPDC007162]|uniref:hypothetical protein n=1 Tax=Streptomyces sp. NPDC007162 TaxID=3156917 RepID=UPI0033DBC370